jgi:hypothetical protein
MAYNPQFPGIDNVLTINKDGVYHIVPMSHKMHMTEGSNTAAKEFGKMAVIKGLIDKYLGNIQQNVQSKLVDILRKPQGSRSSILTEYISKLEGELKKEDNNCGKVDWSDKAQDKERDRRDRCFQLDYERMILISLSRYIEDMPSDGYKVISYKPITLVRFRAKSIEFHVEGKKRAIAIYKRNGYESREKMIENSLKEIGQSFGGKPKTRKSTQPRRKSESGDSSLQVQQPKT